MDANNQVENIARITANIILGIGILSGIIITITGITYLNSYSSREEALAGAYIIYGLIDIVSAIVFWVFVNLLVNISLKLDNRSVVMSYDSIIELASHMKPSQATKINEPIIEPKVVAEKHENETAKLPDAVLQNKNGSIDDDIQNVILGHILSGNFTEARCILMSKTGVSIDQASEYIEKLKADIK